MVWDIPATLREEDLRPSPVVARRLVVIGGGRVDSRALVDRTRLTIGRGDDCDVQLDDPAVSRVHAVLHVADVLEVEDLGSANGTRVRGVRLAPRQLTAIELGEVFDVGGTLLVVQAVDARTTPRRVRPHTHLEARVEDECQRRARARRRPFAIIRVRVDGDFDREALEARKEARPADVGRPLPLFAPGPCPFGAPAGARVECGSLIVPLERDRPACRGRCCLLD